MDPGQVLLESEQICQTGDISSVFCIYPCFLRLVLLNKIVWKLECIAGFGLSLKAQASGVPIVS